MLRKSQAPKFVRTAVARLTTVLWRKGQVRRKRPGERFGKRARKRDWMAISSATHGPADKEMELKSSQNAKMQKRRCN